MIDKEEIENAKLKLKIIVETVRDIFHLKVKKEDEDIYEIDGEQFLSIETVLQYILELEKELEELRLEKGYYLERYKEFNNAFIQGGKKLVR